MWDNLHRSGLGASYSETAGHPANFAKISVSPLVLLICNKTNDPNLQNTYVLSCIFRNFYHQQDCSGRDSVKCNV